MPAMLHVTTLLSNTASTCCPMPSLSFQSDLEPCFQLSKRQRVATQVEERWLGVQQEGWRWRCRRYHVNMLAVQLKRHA